MILLKMAWRNIWRNKRRTMITMASVFFAVILAVLMRSANTGIYDNMVHNVVRFSSGYIQIHKKGYWEEQSIDNGFHSDTQLFRRLSEIGDITARVSRLESFALASSGDKTKGVLMLGAEPEAENRVTDLEGKMISGNFLKENDRSVLLSEELAKSLGLHTGDTVVFLSQGYHGASAAGKYPVSGIVRYGSPELNKRMVNLPLSLMQEMFGADSIITSVSIMVNENSDLELLKKTVLSTVDTSLYEVMDWKEMLPELDQLIEGDLAGDYIVIGTLYMVIAFGVFGTILMMTRERMHEFGILVAIGMRKRLLASMLALETLLLALISALAGMAGALPIILWFKKHPIRMGSEIQKIYDRYGMEAILPFSDRTHVFTEQAGIVCAIALILSLYTTYKILNLKAIDAINT